MSDLNDWNKTIIEEFRANDGKVGGQFEGRSLLLLHTIGAKSGLPRLNPLAYLQDGERYVIIASKAGASTNPDWYYNIRANPIATIEVGREQFEVKAEIMSEPARTELFDKMVAINPGFADYQNKTTRTIPVIVLIRTS